MMRGLALASCVALAAACACTSEVTLSFFQPQNQGDGGESAGGTEAVGTGGAGAETTGLGGADSEVCQMLGLELCNTADDDCNGEVDEGCAHDIFWRPEPDGDSLGHVADGVSFSEVCPTGTLLSGLRVGFGAALNQVAAICSQVGLVEKTVKGVTTFSATVGPRITRTLVPAVTEDTSNQLTDLLCPDDLVASMLEGDDDPTQHIVDVGIRCAPLIVTEQVSGSFFFDLDLAQEQTVPPLACATCTAPKSFAFSSQVPPGQVARRIFGRVSTLVVRLGFGTNAARVANL